MEALWRHTFDNELHVNPEAHSVVLTDTPLNLKSNQERMAEIMFEKFYVPALCMNAQAVLSLYASNHTTGCVLNCGEDMTRVVPIHDGFVLRHAVHQLHFGGWDFTDRMVTSLRDCNGGNYALLSTNVQQEIARDIKETLTYVVLDFAQAMKAATESSSPPPSEDSDSKSYTLPDGQVLAIGTECFSVPEGLFLVALVNRSGPELTDCTLNVILKCDAELHEALYNNIVLTSGSSMFPGIAAHLTQELVAWAPSVLKAMSLTVVAPPERKYSAWLGGSIVASLSTFPQIAVSKTEYEESGASSIVHTKWF